MRKLFKGMILVLAVMVGLGLFVPKAFALNAFQINVYEDIGWSSTAGGYPALTDDVQYVVFDAGSTTLETIYSDTASTAKVNPVVESIYDDDAKIKFWTATADTTVDIVVTDNTTGSSIFLNGVTTSTRTAIINNSPHEKLVCAVYYVTSTDFGPDANWLDTAGGVCGYDTGVDFPKNSLIHDAFIYVHGSTGTGVDLSVGLAADKNSLLDVIKLDYATTYSIHQADLIHPSALASGTTDGAYGDDLAAATSQAESLPAGTGFAAILSASSLEYVQIRKPKLITVASTLLWELTSSHPLGNGLIYVIFEMLLP